MGGCLCNEESDSNRGDLGLMAGWELLWGWEGSFGSPTVVGSLLSSTLRTPACSWLDL